MAGNRVLRDFRIEALRQGKARRAALDRDFWLSLGRTVVVCTPKEGGGGVHACVIKPFKRKVR